MRCRWISSRRGRARTFLQEHTTIWRAAWKPRVTWQRRRWHWSRQRMRTWQRPRTRRADINGFAMLSSGVGQENLGNLRVAPVEEADIADPLHDFAGRLLGQIIERR